MFTKLRRGGSPLGENDRRGWRTTILCSVAQNCGIGLTYGSFGPLLESTEVQLGITRAAATLAIGVIAATISILAPLLGVWIGQVRIGRAMLVGAVLCGIAFGGLAITSSFSAFLLLYGLAGVGMALTAVLGPAAMISRWFAEGRGKRLAIVNLPITMLVAPYCVAAVLPAIGRSGVLASLAVLFFLLAILLAFICEPPENADAAGLAQGARMHSDGSTIVGARVILSRPAFWVLSAGIGVMAGAGTSFSVHIVPIGVGKLLSLPTAAALMSVFAVAGVGGTLLFGWLADRVGPTAVLALAAALQAITWVAVLAAPADLLFPVSFIMGLCVSPLTTLHAAAMSTLFGAANTSRAMGYSYLVKLPFNATLAPIIAALYVYFGDYQIALLALSALLAIVAASIITAMVSGSRNRPTSPAMQ